ncbi:MAG: ATP-binding cassette domain-containing protein [Xanthomonadales bacterium]|nr:ATP-binding cassette domain-containing protein [Gammaproteobacteria bacterium]NNK33292.1 ATP-binding cassette domain-containing protein [Xanthomonadales bacterium]NNK38385.1 ATP-binding cassette domain-containing protein [Xanthomonadales bacterium]
MEADGAGSSAGRAPVSQHNEKPAVIELRDMRFRYPGAGEFELSIPSLSIPSSESVAVVGPSGSGKTTLLGLLAGILRPAQGHVQVSGTELSALGERQRRQFRIRQVGQVFQAFELLHYLTVLENVMLTHFIHAGGRSAAQSRKRALELLTDTGLADRADSRPDELSQGEQQRVAVCRALLNRPALLLADEPTGNLDSENKRNVVDLLLQQSQRGGSTLLMVTHDRSLLEPFATVLDIRELCGAQGKPGT